MADPTAAPRHQQVDASDTLSGTGAPAPGWAGGQPLGFPLPFGRYRLERKLGQGGMGAVYLATDLALSRLVAIKIPSGSLNENAVLHERFYREARLAATLHHPNLCPVYDVGQHEGVHYLVMAYVEGKPLSQFIRPGQKLPARNVVTVVRALALAMHDAHSKGIIHRDLKPSNIVIATNKQPVIMDFGLAKSMDADEGSILTKSGTLMGTPEYMPPEQIDGDQTRIGPRSDLYSLGIIFYELLVGRRPFSGPLTQLITQIAAQAPPSLTKIRPGLDPKLEAICLKTLVKKPEDRFADLRAFADVLTEWLAGKAPEVIVPSADAEESVVVELFDEMAARVASTPRPRHTTELAHGPAERGSIYWGSEQADELRYAVRKPKRKRPPRRELVWLRIFLWTLIPGLLLLTAAFGVMKGKGAYTDWMETRKLQRTFDRINNAPNDPSVVNELNAIQDLLPRHPDWCDRLGMMLAEKAADSTLAEQVWQHVPAALGRPTPAQPYGQRGDSWWNLAFDRFGPSKARFLLRGSELYAEAPSNPTINNRLQTVRRPVNLTGNSVTVPGGDWNKYIDQHPEIKGSFQLNFRIESAAIDANGELVVEGSHSLRLGLRRKHFVVQAPALPEMPAKWPRKSTGTLPVTLSLIKTDDWLEFYQDGWLIAPPVDIRDQHFTRVYMVDAAGNRAEAKDVKVLLVELTAYEPLMDRLAAMKR